ncbi:MAG: hypothetical protein Q8O00_10265, partial [Holophaga sp.]|nr:hypothetical protein [Holophaga sp.]
FFYLGGFKALRVEPDGDATAEAFSGEALFELPAPLGPRKLTFKGLVLKGTRAEGTLDETLKDVSGDLHGWSCQVSRVTLSDKGSRLEGTATLGGLKLNLAPLNLTPQGLTGTLSPGDLPLAEGPFEATLLAGEVTFTATNVKLKGNLEVVIDPPVRHAVTGAELKLDGGAVTFDSALLGGTGAIGSVASNLPLLHKGQTWLVQAMTFGFERGTPILGGPTRLQLPLEVFCRVGATDQPYLTDAIACHLRGKVPAPAPPQASSLRLAARTRKTVLLEVAWQGYSGTFALPAALLHPSGLTAYHVDLQKGSVRVEKGLLVSDGTKLTGSLVWGPNFTYKISFADAPASLADGLYVGAGPLNKPAEAGAYRVHKPFGGTVCDFSPSNSPEGLPDSWMGIYLPNYALALPGEIFTYTPTWERVPVLASAQAGRFEGNGTFGGAVAVDLNKLVNLHIAPVKLEPFELNFIEGSLIHGPIVKGHLDLNADPLLKDFKPPCSFHLTQNGAEQIEIDTQTPSGPMGLKTRLIGVTMVLDSALLNPTNLDFTGRFDFAVAGAALPSVPFDHLVLEASGGGIEGSHEPLTLDFKGSRWANVADRPHVSLWGYPFGLGESGYGVMGDGRFYVGLGGDFEVNPILPTVYNRIFFTTEKDDESKGTLELEKLFDIDQSVASMGSLKASLGFQVATANDQVSDAFFLGTGKLDVAMGDAPFHLDAGMRFGRSYQGASYFPYFYALGHFQTEGGGIAVAPNLEVYGLAGGLAQNFLPDEIRNTTEIKGKPDSSLGLAIMAGVDVGTSDQFTFHGGLDLFISQNFTTLLQGKGWLFCGRDKEPSDNQVTADIRFTRNPNTFDATLTADLNLYGGLLRPMGQVQLYFAPDKQFVHIGTKDAPILVRVKNAWDASGYMTADFAGGAATLGAGAAFGYSKEGNFGIIWGNAWLNARGDLIIEIDADKNPHFLGTLAAEGGAAFGMRFETFWKTYKVTIFSGSIGANLAFQVPGSPTLSGAVTIHYSVLGGLFSGSVGASLDM